MSATRSPLLLTAGPVPLSSAVRQALRQPMVYHRGRPFIELFQRVTAGLKYLFQTKYDVLLLTTSGTGAMEAVVTNLFSPGDAVIVVENGKFSERWSQIGEIFKLRVIRLKIPWGRSVSPDELLAAVRTTSSLKAVFLTHCETSTGALTAVEQLAPLIRQHTEALVIVDAITSAGVLPLKMDQWQIDVAVTASQKGLGLPPGLAMVALNHRAWRQVEQADLPRYYLDLTLARQSLRLERGTPFTPAIPLIVAADVVLQQIQEKGLEAIWQERKEVASDFRAKINRLGFAIFPECPADSLTVIAIPPPLLAEEIASQLRENFGIIVSQGQGQLINKVLRIGHFVNIHQNELNRFTTAFYEIIQQLRR
ncbi:MAG: alanine--glyoxylate aminotransferase family protein [candidate division KSB1 bacterium]|nr:alanine--glyoxylate aminotransferase family protein [candidate division KSB1 bacterium]MDZ7342086.1 alanine--glyoxylate aminotransferase family protein [candidate division KSB1 bacterium]